MVMGLAKRVMRSRVGFDVICPMFCKLGLEDMAEGRCR